MNNCHYCNHPNCPPLNWMYKLDRILPDYKFCPMCGRRMDGAGNEPLTLDELRKMDGEPVWIAPATDGGKIPARWMLVSDYLPENGIFLFMPPGGMTQGYKAVTYGKTWLAYRRRPEEV